MLAPKAKEEKQQELITRQQQLREKVRAFEQEMRLEERRLSEAIFKELKTVIRSISINEKLDLVLEKNAAQVIFTVIHFYWLTEFWKFKKANTARH